MFDQSPYACRMEWGLRGAREAAQRGDIIIIVDVLSFSSTVVTALHHGAILYPHPKNDLAQAYADKLQAELLLGRAEGANLGIPTLSPATFSSAHTGKRFVLCSLNGAACAWIARKTAALLAGCLLNARAVAGVAGEIRQHTGSHITVIPSGEQWDRGNDGEDRLRPAVEDYLGAGSIVHHLTGTKSPEAEVCAGAFRYSQRNIQALLLNCGSGRELIERGFAEDVAHCSRLNVYDSVPILEGQFFIEAKDRRRK